MLHGYINLQKKQRTVTAPGPPLGFLGDGEGDSYQPRTLAVSWPYPGGNFHEYARFHTLLKAEILLIIAQSPKSVFAHLRRVYVYVAVQVTPSHQALMEPHSKRSCGASPSQTSVDSTLSEPAAIGGADLASCSNETVPSTLPIVRPSTSCALTL